MSVGDNIRTARINKGLTQLQLAEILQNRGEIVGNTTISNWEKGISKPDPDTIEKLCNILDVDANYILGFKKEKIVNEFDELELLFDKHKDILKESDKTLIKTIIEERKKEIDKELGEN